MLFFLASNLSPYRLITQLRCPRLYTLHFTLYTAALLLFLAFTPYTLHRSSAAIPRLYTLHFTLYTAALLPALAFTPYTLHPTLVQFLRFRSLVPYQILPC